MNLPQPYSRRTWTKPHTQLQQGSLVFLEPELVHREKNTTERWSHRIQTVNTMIHRTKIVQRKQILRSSDVLLQM